MSILHLAGSRLKASEVLDLLAHPVVRRRFSFTEAEVEVVSRWVNETGIRWGWDGSHRAALGLPSEEQNTWKTGIERLLMGYAMPGEAGQTVFMDIVPYADLDEADAALLGRFLTFLVQVRQTAELLERRLTMEEWATALLQVIDDFLADDDDTREELLVLRRVLAGINAAARHTGWREMVSVDVIRQHLREVMEDTEGGVFPSEGVTFASLLPMRGIPFAVICLIGMDDEAYPRRPVSPDLDLMAVSPLPGDRNRRDDDRYLFLEALLNARSTLYMSYTGRDPKNNTARPPSVLVGELLDYIEDGFGKAVKEGIVVHHRLQGYHPDYFTGTQGLYSYAEDNLRAARAFVAPVREKRPWLTVPLAEREDTVQGMDLTDLIAFFAHPVRFFVQRRMG
ncbi:MAG: exodeoxyribonuclease V subunit gamma, partial [Syntrophales bacterium]|nr:exodeoxyribonuclease V subunit gamma [Syntrophales bacterium]